MDNPFVILHGWGLSARTFSPLAAELRKNHMRVYSPDFPGFDAEHIPGHPLTLTDYAQFLAAYFQKYSIRHPVIIAHSFGGRVALKYQMLYPGRVRALILTGTPGFTPIPRKKLMLFIAIAKVGGFFMSAPILLSAKDKVRSWYYYAVGARDFYRAEGVMRETFKNVVKEPLRDAMESISIPTLLIWGEQDIIVPVRIAREMAGVIRKSALILIPDEGHNVPFKNPKLFVSKILPWISSL